MLGGSSTDTKRVLALGSGQRNLAAAFIIATSNFASQRNVLVYLAAVGLVGMVVILPTAAEFGKRSRATPRSDEPAVSTPTSGPDEPAVSG